jgi:hypothetical protein
MLYTDSSSWLTIEDLKVLDPDIAGTDANVVATVENVPTTGSQTFIQSAIEEAAATLQGMFQNFGYNFFSLNTPAFQQNVLYGIYDSTPPPRIKIGQIVVDDGSTLYASPLKRWVAYLALRNFYQLVSNRVMDDKYQAKMKQLQSDIDNKIWPAFKSVGLPVVFFPLHSPGALYEVNSGTWDSSNIVQVSSGSDSSASYDVAITYSTSDGKVESAGSETITFDMDADNVMSINIASLNPPTNASYWNVYAAVHGNLLRFQTTQPLDVLTYQFPAAPVTTGRFLGRGQAADTTLTFVNAFFKA